MTKNVAEEPRVKPETYILLNLLHYQLTFICMHFLQ